MSRKEKGYPFLRFTLDSIVGIADLCAGRDYFSQLQPVQGFSSLKKS